MDRSTAVVLATLLVSVALVPPTVGGAAATDAAADAPTADNTVTRIDVAANGTAVWTIQVRTRLNSSEEVDSYRAFQERFRENTSAYLDPFRERIRRVVAAAENATGREMRAVSFSASTHIQEVPRRWGVVTYQFTWVNFAPVRDGRVVVGDVFQGGYYLAEDDLLELSGPPGYRVASVDPSPAERSNGTLRWTGPLDFADERPRAVFAPTPTDTTTADRGDGADIPGRGLSPVAWLVVVLGLLVAAAGGYWYLREVREGSGGGPTGASDVSGGGPGTAAGIVTDEERVKSVLAANDGRMKQAALADELDWSASKTSRVVSRMAEEGAVEKLRVGRENVVQLSEE